jgi:hypothetical protein
MLLRRLSRLRKPRFRTRLFARSRPRRAQPMSNLPPLFTIPTVECPRRVSAGNQDLTVPTRRQGWTHSASPAPLARQRVPKSGFLRSQPRTGPCWRVQLNRRQKRSRCAGPLQEVPFSIHAATSAQKAKRFFDAPALSFAAQSARSSEPPPRHAELAAVRLRLCLEGVQMPFRYYLVTFDLVNSRGREAEYAITRKALEFLVGRATTLES